MVISLTPEEELQTSTGCRPSIFTHSDTSMVLFVPGSSGTSPTLQGPKAKYMVPSRVLHGWSNRKSCGHGSGGVLAVISGVVALVSTWKAQVAFWGVPGKQRVTRYLSFPQAAKAL